MEFSSISEKKYNGFKSLHKLPSEWKMIHAYIRLQCIETETEYTTFVIMNKNLEECGWPDYVLKLMDISTFDELTIIAHVQITRIVLHDYIVSGSNVLYNFHTKTWQQPRDSRNVVNLASW